MKRHKAEEKIQKEAINRHWNNVGEDEILVAFDYGENKKLGGAPTELGNTYFGAISRSVLAIIFKFKIK